MAKLNLNKAVLNLENEEIVGSNMGKILASELANYTQGDPLKFMHWAKKFYDGEELELDQTDLQTLKDFIVINNNLTNLTKSRILESIN